MNSHFYLIKILYKLIYFLLILVIPVVLFELYNYSFEKEDQLDYSKLWINYTQQELNTKLSNFHERTGSNYMEKITPTWHHKIGFKDKEVNFDCLKKHF